MPRGGARGQSPGRVAAGPPDPHDTDSQPLWQLFFMLNMFAAMACAMHGKSDGVLLMCLSVFIVAMALQYCLDLEPDDPARVPKFLVGIAVVWACAYQLHAVKVHTSLASLSAGAAVDHAKLREVLRLVPQLLQSANQCRVTRDQQPYLNTLDLRNATGENGTSLNWPAWLFVLTNI